MGINVPGTSSREDAKNKLDSSLSEGVVLRALAVIMMDELNILRALHGLAPRTLAQLKTAMQNSIDAGNAD